MTKALQSLLLALTLSLGGTVSAFDTDKPPPVWTLTNTYKFLEDIIPILAFSGADAAEVLEFLRGYRPSSYSPEMVVDEALLVPVIKFSMETRDQSIADILFVVAERLKADVVIRPGCIQLVQRKVER